MGKKEIDQLPYRDSVSCLVYKGGKFLLVQLVGWPEDWWKFPQGGIEKGESEEIAAKRELQEEMGTDRFIIKQQANHRHQYEWTLDSVKKAGFKWRGQVQRFLLVEFVGDDNDLAINQNEVYNYKWGNAEETLKAVDIDHPLFLNYQKAIKTVFAEFGIM